MVWTRIFQKIYDCEARSPYIWVNMVTT